ncbi:elongation factor P hydroxylase [Paraglaciecola mesophila]|uniref:Elongation factor P hydroxylase n=1 Tax=Paraglaciecola mesophila TaxID=197222 RepID=A0ABU9T1H3_9ALTE
MNIANASIHSNDFSEQGRRHTSAEIHQYQDVIALFDAAFNQSENTRLIKGAGEPEYIPANELCDFHQVIFAHGYFASALHEIAHWCIAGKRRRMLNDYGYWYCPDGRTEAEQKKFEQVEIKPQAIEWAFSVAANKAFRVSTDNLNGTEPNTKAFTLNVHQQVLNYLRDGFPPRAALFIDALAAFYATEALSPAKFSLPEEWRAAMTKAGV